MEIVNNNILCTIVMIVFFVIVVPGPGQTPLEERKSKEFESVRYV